MADAIESRTYSVSEAIGYASEKISYCDRMEAAYPHAKLVALREHAVKFLDILQRDPKDLDPLRGLRDELRQRKDQEGTGWSVLLSYVQEYIEELERRPA